MKVCTLVYLVNHPRRIVIRIEAEEVAAVLTNDQLSAWVRVTVRRFPRDPQSGAL